MTETALLKQIEAAKLVISDAENDLQVVVKDAAVAQGPENAEANEVVKAASLKLSVAEEQLSALEKLLALANIETARTKVETARTKVSEAEKDLDRVLKAVVPSSAGETWVTEVVESAFTRLRTAKGVLIELEASVATDTD